MSLSDPFRCVHYGSRAFLNAFFFLLLFFSLESLAFAGAHWLWLNTQIGDLNSLFWCLFTWFRIFRWVIFIDLSACLWRLDFGISSKKHSYNIHWFVDGVFFVCVCVCPFHPLLIFWFRRCDIRVWFAPNGVSNHFIAPMHVHNQRVFDIHCESIHSEFERLFIQLYYIPFHVAHALHHLFIQCQWLFISIFFAFSNYSNEIVWKKNVVKFFLLKTEFVPSQKWNGLYSELAVFFFFVYIMENEISMNEKSILQNEFIMRSSQNGIIFHTYLLHNYVLYFHRQPEAFFVTVFLFLSISISLVKLHYSPGKVLPTFHNFNCLLIFPC